jgi:hypothetical protein
MHFFPVRRETRVRNNASRGRLENNFAGVPHSYSIATLEWSRIRQNRFEYIETTILCICRALTCSLALKESIFHFPSCGRWKFLIEYSMRSSLTSLDDVKSDRRNYRNSPIRCSLIRLVVPARPMGWPATITTASRNLSRPRSSSTWSIWASISSVESTCGAMIGYTP